MKTVTATELKTKTGETLDAARREPVSIEKNGRAIAVIVPQADYERLMRMENDYWLARVEESEKSGYIGTAATSTFFKETLKGNAKARPDKRSDALSKKA
jgi:antitoxin Phd